MTEVSDGKPKSFSNGDSVENVNGDLNSAANGPFSSSERGSHETKDKSSHSTSNGNHSTASQNPVSNQPGISTKTRLKEIDKNKPSQGNMGCNNTRTVVDPAKIRSDKHSEEQLKQSEKCVTKESDVACVESLENVSVSPDKKPGCKTESGDSVFCDQDGSGQGEVTGNDSGVNRSRNTSHTSESTNSDTEKAMIPSESASESTEKVLSAQALADSSDVTDVEETGEDTNGMDSSGVEGGWQHRPHSLSLPKPLQHYERNRHKGSRTFAPGDTSSDEVSVDSDASSLGSSLHGTILRKGDMIEFVADNLQEKIRGSRDSSSMGSRTSSIRSISSVNSISSYTSSLATSVSGMSRSPSSLVQQSPDAIPPIDPQAVQDLESQARVVADRVDLMMGNLKANLCKMSAITVGTLDAYKHSVESTCEAVDASIKSMYALMAKCEELSRTVNPIYQLADQIKEIKRLLDLFESQVDAKTS